MEAVKAMVKEGARNEQTGKKETGNSEEGSYDLN